MYPSIAPYLFFGAFVSSQKTVAGPTQPGLPDGCVGSYPNIDLCRQMHWHLSGIVDECAPEGPYPVSGQQVYIKDELNFCINLPNPNSIELQNLYYSKGLFPTIVQAEGYVQSFCMGSYLPPGSLPFPAGGVRSAHVIKNYTKIGSHYLQVAGLLDCNVLKINCTQSSPDAYDDGGQYDNGPFISCGKEPYSGVDSSPSGNEGWQDYVEMAGESIFCMRVCEPGNQVPGGVCDVTQDRKGCTYLMGVDKFDGGFTFTDIGTGQESTAVVSLPPVVTTAPFISAASILVNSTVLSVSGAANTTAPVGSAVSTTRPNSGKIPTLKAILVSLSLLFL